MRSQQRVAAAVALAFLVTTACGARLTPAQRTAALSQSGSQANTTGGSPTGETTGATTPGATGTTGTGTTGSTGSTGTTTGTPGSTTGTTGTTGSTGGSGTTGSTTGGGATGDFTKAPAGGNGGATDVGVTATSITISNVADVSGAVPGLFEDARFAVQAYFKYFNARYGTLYGRKINVLALDSQLDSGANRSAAIQQCSDSFAGVGSVSAFDQGGAPEIKKCGIPDIRGLSTTNQMKAVPNSWPINAAGVGGYRSLGQFGYVAEKFPDAVKKAIYVYSDGEVTRQTAEEDISGAEGALGFTFIDRVPIGTAETNYGPAVQSIKGQGAKFVTFLGAYQQAANLAKEFVKQGYKPEVYQPTVTSYTPNFIRQAGSAANGTYVAVSPSLIEEINGNPELTLYAQWLKQVKPNAVPTAIGQYAWGAAALWVELMIKLGPKPTRKGLLQLVPGVRSYTGNGLFPAQDVGGRLLTDCTQQVQVQNGKFVRVDPPGTRQLRCKDGIWDVKNKRKIAPSPPR